MTNSKIAKIVAYVLLLLAVVAAIGVIAHFTSGFTSDFKTFYVTVNGKDVMSSSSGYQVSQAEPLKVDVKYAFGFASTGNKDFSVKIVPNKTIGEDFNFTVGEDAHSFYEEKDLTAGFRIEKTENAFTITPRGDTLPEILRALYPDNEISDCENCGYEDMFSAVITSYNSEASITLNFSLPGTVTGIRLSATTIIF